MNGDMKVILTSVICIEDMLGLQQEKPQVALLIIKFVKIKML